MKIENLSIKNFRSFGEEIVFSPKPELNIVIGENNAGKSNIFIALDKLKKVLISRSYHHPIGGSVRIVVFDPRDWYCGKNNKEMEIDISLILDENELDELVALFSGLVPEQKKERLTDLKEELGNRIEIILRHKYGGTKLPYFKIGDLFADLRGRASIKPESFNLSSYQNIEWKGIIEEYFSGKTKLLDIIKHKFKGKENPLVNFSKPDIADFIVRLFNEKLKLFKDIRQKPIGENKDVYESLGGRETADVLLTLKNSEDPSERDKYKAIQEKFTTLFPTIKLEAIKSKETEKSDIHMICNDIKHELPIEFMGTGIMEMVVFLTNIIASKDNIFVIEEPELHLHPSSQRLFLDLLNEYKKNNQFFVISHSPYFVNIENITDNISLKIRNGKSIVKQISNNYFDANDISKIKKILDSENREMFFSKKVLLVEGSTEKGAFPIFAKDLEKDFDKNNIFTCSVYGKDSFSIFQKILEGFDIPYCVVCDDDAKSIVKIDKNKLIVLNPDFEGILKREGYEKLLEQADKEIVGRSKPRKGRLVAKKIIELNKAIPKEFIEAIEKITTI